MSRLARGAGEPSCRKTRRGWVPRKPQLRLLSIVFFSYALFFTSLLITMGPFAQLGPGALLPTKCTHVVLEASLRASKPPFRTCIPSTERSPASPPVCRCKNPINERLYGFLLASQASEMSGDARPGSSEALALAWHSGQWPTVCGMGKESTQAPSMSMGSTWA